MKIRKTSMATTYCIASVLALAVALGGCSSNDATSNASESAGGPAVSNSFDSELAKPGTLTVATTGTAPPLTTTDNSGKIIGFWPDVAAEIAKRLKLKVDVQQIAWDGLLAGVTAGKYDLGDGGILQTEERKASDAFIVSAPILNSGVAFLVMADSPVKSWKDLEKRVLGGTSGEKEYEQAKKYLEENGIKPSSFETFGGHTEGFLGLESGRIDGFVLTSNSAAYLASEKKTMRAVFPAINVMAQGTVVSPNAKNLAAAVDERIKAMISDGTMEKIAMKWFGTPDVIFKD